ncbi:MAG TPA: hypothetical protein VFX49_10500 [Chloroflexota bacterium]|nr:hypothetical protein [Chloroflexota bacterium]
MSAARGVDTGERMAEPPRAARRVPTPPSEHEDRGAWKLVGRGDGTPGKKVLSSYLVRFNREQADWIDQECERTGVTPFELIQRLVDQARSSQTK